MSATRKGSIKAMVSSASGPVQSSLIVEASRFAWDTFFDTADYTDGQLAFGNAVARGWQPLSLPGAASGVQEVTFADILPPGTLPPEYAALGSAVHFYTGELEGQQTVVVAFRSTDEGDAEFAFQAAALPPNPFGAGFGWDLYYLAHAQTVAAALTAATDPASGIERILITGHSLGGVIAELTAERLLADSFSFLLPKTLTVTFGSPGSTEPGASGTLPDGLDILNFTHTDDFVARLSDLSPLFQAAGVAREGVTHAVARPEATLPALAPEDLDTVEEIFAAVTDPAFKVEHQAQLYIDTIEALVRNEHLVPDIAFSGDPERWLSTAPDSFTLGDATAETIAGGNGNDVIIGEAGDDFLQGSRGNDGLAGEAGNDRLFGGAGDDRLDGGAGNDRVFGGEGQDNIWMSAGCDYVDGGNGTDVYGTTTVIEADGTPDGSMVGFATLHDSGRTGLDFVGAELIDREGLSASGQAFIGLAGLAADAGIEFIRGVPRAHVRTTIMGTEHGDDHFDFRGVVLDNIANVHGDFRNGDGDDTMLGNAQRNRFYGDGGNDRLYGGGADDMLRGGTGNDRILGEAGNDSLFGDAGNDSLAGGTGNDALWGGAGSDRFLVMSGRFGADRIGDFGAGDRVDLAAGMVVRFGLGTDTVAIWQGGQALGSIEALNGHLWVAGDFV